MEVMEKGYPCQKKESVGLNGITSSSNNSQAMALAI
jgi:hypothetical protein